MDAFNKGVTTGDFSEMIELFAPDVPRRSENIPVGPFEGRDSIAAAYSVNPPTDQILILRTRDDANTILAEFAWSSSPNERGGDIEIRPLTQGIAHLLVVYGGPPNRWN